MSIYRQKVMSHYSAPQNKGKLTKPSRVFNGANPLCGDKIIFEVKIDNNKKITAVAWDGAGCAISQAAASIFSEMIKGKTLSAARKIKSEQLLKVMDIKLSPVRRKCALLPLFTIKEKEIKIN